MDITTHQSMEEAVRQFMKSRIEQEAQKISEEYKAKALKDLDESVRKAVTDTAIHFSRMIDVRDGGDRLTISISDHRDGGKPHV